VLPVPRLACFGVQTNIGASSGLIFNDNVAFQSVGCGSDCPPYGVEFWGTGSQGANSLVEGSFANGYTWGYGEGSWAINDNRSQPLSETSTNR
jgi:hypothetical protein